MIIGDKLTLLDYYLVVDLVVDFVVVDLAVEFLGYRWGQIVNRRDVNFVERDSYEKCKLAKESLNLKRPEKRIQEGNMQKRKYMLFNTFLRNTILSTNLKHSA